jgi:peroxiredoxin
MMKKISVALLSTMVFAGCISEKRDGETALPVGTPMPEFSVSSLDGTTVTSADLAGAPSVVAFFRTTCPDCSREMPNVEAAFKQVSGVRFVAISKEDNATVAVPEYWEATGMTMPYYFDPSGEVSTAFDIHFVPTLYLFDSKGKVAYAAVETFDFSVEELVKLIKELK